MATPSASRREFLKTLGTALATTAAGPTILGATDKAGAKRPVIGTGEFTYEVYHDWGTLPAGLSYGNTHGVCEDSQGNIYIHHTVNASSDRHDTMVVFDQHGKFVRSWGAGFEGNGAPLQRRSSSGTSGRTPQRDHSPRLYREIDDRAALGRQGRNDHAS